MNTVSLHVGFVRLTESNDIHPVYASSREEMFDKVKEMVVDFFKEELEDFDVSNSQRFIEEESESDSLVNLYKEHLDDIDKDKSFEFHTKDEVTLILNNKFDILEIDVG